jgi:hypothetical protein
MDATSSSSSSLDWRSLLHSDEPARQLGDGIDNALLFTAAAPSNRHEVIHEAHPAGFEHEGHGSALRVGQYKLLAEVGKDFWITEGLTAPGTRRYTVSCPYPPPDPATLANGTEINGTTYFLYNIEKDPCEHLDLSGVAASAPVLVSLVARLAQYAATAVPTSWASREGLAACGERDGKDSPAEYNHTWTPWC